MRGRLLSLAIVLATREASAGEPCLATAVIERGGEGDGALVDSLEAALRGRGIETAATAECPAARVRIARRGTTIAVSVVDPDGRRSERSLATLDAAASLIESWARQDLNAPLLVGRSYEPVDQPEPSVVAWPARATARAHDPLTLVVAGESSFATNGGVWLGARATACARIGRVCLGLAGRTLGNDSHRSYDVLAAIDVPFFVGQRVAIVTGAGAGPGWFLRAELHDTGPTTWTHAGTRLDAHASVSIAIAPHVALHAGLSAGLSPSGQAVRTDGESMTTNDEPTVFLRGDLGLRIGAP